MNQSVVECQMMIRKPINEVFEAFINPEITTHFWFTKSSGSLEEGKMIHWEWEMYGVSAQVFVKEIIKNQKILIEWDEPKTSVEFEFIELSPIKTYVIIRNFGFIAEGNELINKIKDNTGGFTTVLDGAKAWLEHHIKLNLILDKFPKEMNKQTNGS